MITELTSLDSDVIARLRRLTSPQEPRFFEEMVTLFIEEADKRLALMFRALRGDDGDGLAEAAHALGGGGMMVGAHRLAALCQALQQRPYPSAAQSRELVDAAQQEYAEVIRLLALALKSAA